MDFYGYHFGMEILKSSVQWWQGSRAAEVDKMLFDQFEALIGKELACKPKEEIDRVWARAMALLDMVELIPEPCRVERLANAWTWVFCLLGIGDADAMVRVAEELHRRGVDPNAKDAEGWSAIRQQACFGHARVVHCLLRLGADPDEALPGLGHSSAEDCARANGHGDLGDLLLACKEKKALEAAAKPQSSKARAPSL